MEASIVRAKSAKRRQREREAQPVRDALRWEAGACELCGNQRRPLDVHEICRGVNRQKALDKRFALLVVCRPCHEQLGSAAAWPQSRQLAVLAARRPHDYDLEAFLRLTSPRAMQRITQEEVQQWAI